MKNSHLRKGTKDFFEGWYFKLSNETQSIAFIPGYNICQGKKMAFIQVITEGHSYMIDYPFHDLHMHRKKMRVKIGDNLFSDQGMIIHIETPEFQCHGKVCFQNLMPLKYDIMGPFAMIPQMQCNHGVISMKHRIRGQMITNGKKHCFNNGTGYIEKDWGNSFPSAYSWVQCNGFPGDTAIMVAVADIPFAGLNFTGMIASVCHNGKQYRLATYNGGKVLMNTEQEIIVMKGKNRLIISLEDIDGKELRAPAAGCMDRKIKETLLCSGRFQFFAGDKRVFDYSSSQASKEWVRG